MQVFRVFPEAPPGYTSAQMLSTSHFFYYQRYSIRMNACENIWNSCNSSWTAEQYLNRERLSVVMYTTQPKQLWFLELVNGIRTHQWTGNTTVEIYEIIV